MIPELNLRGGCTGPLGVTPSSLNGKVQLIPKWYNQKVNIQWHHSKILLKLCVFIAIFSKISLGGACPQTSKAVYFAPLQLILMFWIKPWIQNLAENTNLNN